MNKQSPFKTNLGSSDLEFCSVTPHPQFTLERDAHSADLDPTLGGQCRGKQVLGKPILSQNSTSDNARHSLQVPPHKPRLSVPASSLFPPKLISNDSIWVLEEWPMRSNTRRYPPMPDWEYVRAMSPLESCTIPFL